MNSMSSKLSEKDSNRHIFGNVEGFHIPTKSDEGRTVPKLMKLGVTSLKLSSEIIDISSGPGRVGSVLPLA